MCNTAMGDWRLCVRACHLAPRGIWKPAAQTKQAETILDCDNKLYP